MLRGDEAILGEGLTGPEARGVKSQLNPKAGQPLGLAAAEVAGSRWRPTSPERSAGLGG